MKQMYMLYPGGKTHALTLSYDDGVGQDIRLLGYLKKYGVKCTFNICSGNFCPEEQAAPETRETRKLSRQECLELYDSPLVEIASHAAHHNVLTTVPESVAMQETISDRMALEDMFDRPVRGFAYPCSCHSPEVIDILRHAGFCYARGGSDDHNIRLPRDYMKWMPTCRHRDPDLMQVADHFLSAQLRYQGPLLFMLMGHSYEFDQAGNWHVMENFLEKMSGRENIWYATCQEIHDAHEAYKRLIFTADGKRIINPSFADVWLQIDGETYVIPGGKMIRL